MSEKKKIIDSRADSDGNIIQVKFEGNINFTDIERAIEMADNDKISNAHVVRRKGKKPFLRTNPNSSIKDNLDNMAGDD
ncbi:MAG: DUF3892 domain-containing protein [Rhodobacteraceae bacterium]|nr:DUF3892 domain-containing protein [Paracoccaceae bacterium]MCY4326801.1 DUF3892 domain-containing protein [Paracoccaceae bacterium]